MKKIVNIVLTVLLLIVVACCLDKSITFQPSAHSLTKEGPIINTTGIPLNQFILDVTLDDSANKLFVKQTIEYCNNTGKGLQEIYFNLIPEAFRKKQGGITMQDIIIKNQVCQIKKVKGTVYKVDLPTTLAALETLKIQMEYQVNIPNLGNPFGYKNEIYNLGNFIVTPAVYEEEGWSIKPYVDIGDAYYTDISNYDVTIHVPKGYKVAATGKDDGTGTFHAENVRDFAFCASTSFETLTEQYDGMELKVFYTSNMRETAERAMVVAKKSLRLFNQTFGEYPYDTLSIVLNWFSNGTSGMEYPTLIMVSQGRPIEELGNLGIYKTVEDMKQAYGKVISNTTCHEVAHQWFYGIVGNDQITSPWLDEGICRYAEYLYWNEYKEEEKLDNWWATDARMKAEHEKAKTDETDLMQSLYYWNNERAGNYGKLYDKGGSLLYQMQERMGKESFLMAMKEYVSHFAYRFVTAESFQEFWNSKGDFKELFNLYLRESTLSLP